MAPKKGEAVLLQELLVHTAWVESNLGELRCRGGHGLKGELRQHQGPQEQAMYQWLHKHAEKCEAYPDLARKLRDLDAIVDGAAAGVEPWGGANAVVAPAMASTSSGVQEAGVAAEGGPPSPGLREADSTPAKKRRVADDLPGAS